MCVRAHPYPSSMYKAKTMAASFKTAGVYVMGINQQTNMKACPGRNRGPHHRHQSFLTSKTVRPMKISTTDKIPPMPCHLFHHKSLMRFPCRTCAIALHVIAKVPESDTLVLSLRNPNARPFYVRPSVYVYMHVAVQCLVTSKQQHLAKVA